MTFKCMPTLDMPDGSIVNTRNGKKILTKIVTLPLECIPELTPFIFKTDLGRCKQ